MGMRIILMSLGKLWKVGLQKLGIYHRIQSFQMKKIRFMRKWWLFLRKREKFGMRFRRLICFLEQRTKMKWKSWLTSLLNFLLFTRQKMVMRLNTRLNRCLQGLSLLGNTRICYCRIWAVGKEHVFRLQNCFCLNLTCWFWTSRQTIWTWFRLSGLRIIWKSIIRRFCLFLTIEYFWIMSVRKFLSWKIKNYTSMMETFRRLFFKKRWFWRGKLSGMRRNRKKLRKWRNTLTDLELE